MAKESKAFGSQRAKKAHLMRGTGGLSAEIADVRADVEEGFQNLEERTGYPELDFHDLTDGAIAAAGGDVTLIGRELLQGQTFDKLNVVEGAFDMLIECLKPGKSGISVIFETGAGALAVSLAADLLTVTLPVAGQDTADNIATAINADAANCNGVLRANVVAGGMLTQAGLGAVALPLAGGVGDYAGNKVMVGGIEALPQNETGTTSVAKWTDTSLKVTTPAVGGVGDHAQITVSSDGTRADALTAVLT